MVGLVVCQHVLSTDMASVPKSTQFKQQVSVFCSVYILDSLSGNFEFEFKISVIFIPYSVSVTE